MSDCDPIVTNQRLQPLYGVPNGVYRKLLIRENGMTIEAPADYQIPACNAPAGVPFVTYAAGVITFTDPATGDSIAVNQTTNRLISVIAGVSESFVLTPA